MTRPDEHPDYLDHPFGAPASNPWAQPPVFGEPRSGKSRPTSEEVRRELEQAYPHLAAQRQARTKG